MNRIFDNFDNSPNFKDMSEHMTKVFYKYVTEFLSLHSGNLH